MDSCPLSRSRDILVAPGPLRNGTGQAFGLPISFLASFGSWPYNSMGGDGDSL